MKKILILLLFINVITCFNPINMKLEKKYINMNNLKRNFRT